MAKENQKVIVGVRKKLFRMEYFNLSRQSNYGKHAFAKIV
jgi:hypothetical protein